MVNAFTPLPVAQQPGNASKTLLNGVLLKSTAVAALGGLLFGFDTAVIAGTTQQLTDIFQLTPTTLGLTVFIGLVGTVILAGRTAATVAGGDMIGDPRRNPVATALARRPMRRAF